jgi:hypothetical protein
MEPLEKESARSSIHGTVLRSLQEDVEARMKLVGVSGDWCETVNALARAPRAVSAQDCG